MSERKRRSELREQLLVRGSDTQRSRRARQKKGALTGDEPVSQRLRPGSMINERTYAHLS